VIEKTNKKQYSINNKIIDMQDYQGCRGDGISIPIPIPYPQKILWVFLQDPQTHKTPKSYIPISAPCLFTTRGLF